MEHLLLERILEEYGSCGKHIKSCHTTLTRWQLLSKIYVNYLNARERFFEGFEVVARPALIANPVEDNMKKMHVVLREMSSTGVADAEFRRATIFVRGDDEEIARRLKEGGIAFVGDELNRVRLDLERDLNIIRALFYRAFSRYADRKGFKMFWDRRRSG